jgi:hypothetical protein
MNLRVSLDQGDLGAKRGKKKCVAPHASRRVHNGRQCALGHSASPRQRLAPALAAAQSEADGAADKVDHYR